jgi:hypothetical protein
MLYHITKTQLRVVKTDRALISNEPHDAKRKTKTYNGKQRIIFPYSKPETVMIAANLKTTQYSKKKILQPIKQEVPPPLLDPCPYFHQTSLFRDHPPFSVVNTIRILLCVKILSHPYVELTPFTVPQKVLVSANYSLQSGRSRHDLQRRWIHRGRGIKSHSI